MFWAIVVALLAARVILYHDIAVEAPPQPAPGATAVSGLRG
ncbi:hypothetical protein [Enterovirga aerilata]|nr:hypothetical protein [Enterovirga sp. DB1703]